jgi:integrase
MGRRRDNPEGLPKRVYFKNGAYHYVDTANKWHRLGAAWDRKAKDEYAKVSDGNSAGGSVGELLENYLRYLAGRVAAGKASPRTLADRRTDAAKLTSEFGSNTPVASIKRKNIAFYLQNRRDKNGKPAPIRANREIALLSAAYNRDVTIEHNPCLHVPRNEENERDRYVTHYERRRFSKACCPPWLRAYLLLKYLLALRQADMLKLDRMMEKPKGLEVVIGKGKGGKRQVRLFTWTWALRTTVHAIHKIVDSRADKSGEVKTTCYFPAEGTTAPLTTAGFKSQWRRSMAIWKGMGNESYWEHDIRGKNASDSRDEVEAQQRLAHTDVKTTRKHYLRGPARIKSVKPLH